MRQDAQRASSPSRKISHGPHRLSRCPAPDRRRLVRFALGPHPCRRQPRHRRRDRPLRLGRPRRPRPRARSRRQGLQGLEEDQCLRALEDDAQGRRPAARARRPRVSRDDDGAGQAARRGKGRDPQRRRHDRLVRRGSAARLRPRHPGARRRHLPARDQGAGRPGRGVHAVEFPDQPDREEALGRARCRLLDHRQGARGDAGLAGRADPLLRRRRRAGRNRQPGLRRPGRDLVVPDPASRSFARSRSPARPPSASSSRPWPACT